MADKTFNFSATLYFDPSVPDRHETPVTGSLNAPDALSAIKALAEGRKPHDRVYSAVVYDEKKPAFGYASGESRSDRAAREKRDMLIKTHSISSFDVTRTQFDLRARIGRWDKSEWLHHLEIDADGQWVPLEQRVE